MPDAAKPFDPAVPDLALDLRPPGIWFSRSRATVSYPDDGNALCRQIEERSFWFRHRNRCIVSLVHRFSTGGDFLDIGGGNGFVAKGLADSGVSCTLLEPGLEGALAAHERGIVRVICAGLEDVAFRQGSFAAAGMFDVLEHIEDDVGALRQVHHLLEPGGKIYISVPAHQALFSSEDIEAGHFRRYSRKSLTKALSAAGFRTSFCSYLFAPLPLPVLLFRVLPGKLGLRKGRDAQRDEAEHVPGGFASRAIDQMLDAEFRRLDSGRPIQMGTSCLCVATRD